MIIVTGGAGFIGSALIWELNRQGCDDILVVDNLGNEDKWKNLRGLRFRNYVHKSQFLEKLEADEFLADTIYHLGACSSTTEKNSEYLISNNYEYSKRICRYAMSRSLRMVYASSAATYGNGECGYSDQTGLMNLKPMNMYGYSKHLFDLWAQQEGFLHCIAGVKFFNVFGPNENHKKDMRSMVVKAWEQILSDQKVRLFKSHHPDFVDGGQKRDFVYVKDVVKTLVYLGNHKNLNGIFNLGSGIAHTWIDLVKPIFQAMSLPVQIEFVPMPVELRDRYQYYTCADMSSWKTHGFEPTNTPLSEAVTDFVLNYLQPRKFLEHS